MIDFALQGNSLADAHHDIQTKKGLVDATNALLILE
jgi:hypothetical protein